MQLLEALGDDSASRRLQLACRFEQLFTFAEERSLYCWHLSLTANLGRLLSARRPWQLTGNLWARRQTARPASLTVADVEVTSRACACGWNRNNRPIFSFFRSVSPRGDSSSSSRRVSDILWTTLKYRVQFLLPHCIRRGTFNLRRC